MTELIFTCGLPGSGKSTWARLMQEKGYYWLSSDEIRRAVNVGNADIFDTMNQTAIRLLNQGVNVIYDATNLWRRYRMHALEVIKAKCPPNVFFRIELFIVPYELDLERNHERKGNEVVPDQVIDRFKRNFQLPQYFEGWDLIHINDNSIPDLFDYAACEDFNQKNPHHTLSLGDHMRKAARIAHEQGFSETVQEAALYHDIGKVYTQTMSSDGVAHYYGHECVSAYLYLLHMMYMPNFKYEDYADIIFLINYHMRPMNWTEKSYARDVEKFGERRVRMLKQLNYCDTNAH